MANINLEAYLFFKGQCREAMEFYKSVFGGELSVTTYKDAGVDAEGTSPDWLMHASLQGGEAKLGLVLADPKLSAAVDGFVVEAAMRAVVAGDPF